MTQWLSNDPAFEVGAKVRYTPAARAKLMPPSDDAGEVLELRGDPVHTLMVQWPFGLALEDPRDVRKAA